MREQILIKLLAMLSKMKVPDSMSFNHTGRTFINWDKLSDINQPALFVLQNHQEIEEKEYGLPKLNIYVRALITFRLELESDVEPETIINTYIDAASAILKPLPTTMLTTQPGSSTPRAASSGKQTLGGLVEHCYIEGTILFDPGLDGDQQGVVSIPITIRTTG